MRKVAEKANFIAAENSLKMKTFIDLFAGCGGLSLGLMQAGWNGLFAIERDKYAFKTLKVNLIDKNKHGYRFKWPHWLEEKPWEIGYLISSKWKKIENELTGNVALIAGGPPCQGFSFAGRRRRDDPRNELFEHYIEIVDLIQPAFLLIENVHGITVEHGRKENKSIGNGIYAYSKSYSEIIKDRLVGLGYHIYSKTIDSYRFGVPQYRPRHIIIGVHGSINSDSNVVDPFTLMEKYRTKFNKSIGLTNKKDTFTVEDAISDLLVTVNGKSPYGENVKFDAINYKGPKTKYQKALRSGMSYREPPNSLRLANHRPETRRKFEQILKCRKGVMLSSVDRERLNIKKNCIVPLAGNVPSHTLTTLPDDMVHYVEPRILTVRECARLQSFPDWFRFEGNYTTGGERRVLECPRYTQVGNAVPPRLAEMLGIILLKYKENILKSKL